MRKKLPKRLAAVAIGLVLALLLGEAVARIAGLGDTTLTRGRLHAFDPDAGWRCAAGVDARYMQPGSFNVRVAVNAEGLRDRERPLEKPAGERRVVVLGDSFVWGYGVEQEEMLTTRLTEALPGVDAINLGVNGYSTVQELVLLETVGLRYDPDIVLLAFTWNDLGDNLDDKNGGRPWAALGDDGGLVVHNRPVSEPWKSPAKQWFRRHSRLFAFGEYCTELVKTARAASRPRTARPRTQGGGGGHRPGDLDAAAVLGKGSAEADRAWRVFAAVLREVRDLVVANGARLVVVDNPSRSVVFTRATVKRLAEEGVDADPDRIGRRLEAICKELGIPFIDPVPAFRAHDDATSLFLVRNGHWSAAGHALVAAEAAERLRGLLASAER